MLHMPALCNDRSTTTAQIKSLFPLKRQVGILIKKKKKLVNITCLTLSPSRPSTNYSMVENHVTDRSSRHVNPRAHTNVSHHLTNLRQTWIHKTPPSRFQK